MRLPAASVLSRLSNEARPSGAKTVLQQGLSHARCCKGRACCTSNLRQGMTPCELLTGALCKFDHPQAFCMQAAWDTPPAATGWPPPGSPRCTLRKAWLPVRLAPPGMRPRDLPHLLGVTPRMSWATAYCMLELLQSSAQSGSVQYARMCLALCRSGNFHHQFQWRVALHVLHGPARLARLRGSRQAVPGPCHCARRGRRAGSRRSASAGPAAR